MMRDFLRSLAVVIVMGLVLANAGSAAEKTPQHRLAIQVDQNDPEVMNQALNNAQNVIEYFNGRGEDVEIEIVAYGPGLHMLRADTSPTKDRIKWMVEQMFPAKITFAACNITKQGMEKREGHTVTIIPQATIVPSGVVELMRLQEQGWSYVRPLIPFDLKLDRVLCASIEELTVRRILCVAAAVLVLAVAQPSRADEAIVTYKSLAPDAALELARAAMDACRSQGYQIAVAVVDRFGQPQVMLRDRFAGPHTPSTATNKAWTAVSFRTNTRDLVQPAQPGQPLAGLGNLPHVVLLGGGVMIEAAGSLLGAIGVSGAPGGEEDERCAKAGLDKIRDKLDF